MCTSVNLFMKMGNTQSSDIVIVAEYIDAMNVWERAIKRTMDIFASFCGILLLSPVLLIIYVVVLYKC